MPRVSVASATRATATMYAAVRMSTLFFLCISRTSLNDLTMTSLRRALIVASRQKRFCRSCTHSKYETVTPPRCKVRGWETLLRGCGRPPTRGSVRGLRDDLRVDARRVVFADLVLDRGGDEDVAVQLEELGVGDLVRAREPDHRARLALPGVDLLRVQPLGVVHAPAGVRHRDDACADLGHELRGERAGVPKALHHDLRVFQIHAQMLGRLDDRVHGAPRGGLVASLAPADRQRLAGHNGERGVALVHRVRVHDPGHRLRVRVHVGRGYVAIRTDEQLDLRGVAARQRLELLPLIVFGSQMTPPLAPPYGMPTTAHFHVIHIARALTSPSETEG